MIGKRVDHISPHELREGEYTKWHGDWYAYCPGPGKLIANLGAHRVDENADGTITVSPSIACGNGSIGDFYHGFIEGGVWWKV